MTIDTPGTPGTPLHPEPTGRYLIDVLGVAFTEAQLAIATHPLTPQLVVAGAGSGKTMVMAARVVHAVAYEGVPPSRVLGLTFTN
ncbi:MAG TPA: UvrD-helicase domain-containing protein, partial [Mycobacteriales bacterium]|nr:UvrD-helicase domain-containing protein [Mycobacteriales bacterium]